jgi:flagellar biosynthesis/type III secretory pathway ATPase
MSVSAQINIHVRDAEVSARVYSHGHFVVLGLSVGEDGDTVKFFVKSFDEVEALAKGILVAAAAEAAKVAAEATNA